MRPAPLHFPLTSATVTIDGRAYSNTASPDPDTTTVLIDVVEITFGRPAGTAHQDDGDLHLELLAPSIDEARLMCRFDAPIRVSVTAAGLSWTIGYGYTLSGTYRRHNKTQWLVSIAAHDVIAAAAGTPVLTAPGTVWPRQSVEDRAAAINAALGRSKLVGWTTPSHVAPIEPNGDSLLDLAQRITPPGWVVLESGVADRLIATDMLRPSITWPFGFTLEGPWSGPYIRQPTDGTALIDSAIDVPATAVEDVPRILDRSGWITAIKLDYHVDNAGDWADESVTLSPLPLAVRDRAVITWSTDFIDLDNPSNADGFRDWAWRLVDEAQPSAPTLEETTITLGALSAAQVRSLTALGRRQVVMAKIPPSDASPDVEQAYLLLGATITLHAADSPTSTPTLTLTDVALQAARLSGIGSLRFTDIPLGNSYTEGSLYTPRPRFTDVDADSDTRLRISDTTLVTVHRPPLPLNPVA